MKPFRSVNPQRTCSLKYKTYQAYKVYLRSDFGTNCGYCADADAFSGGKNGFHIDHFRPLNHFSKLKCDYTNLVYACSYCNIAKSDDWPCLGLTTTYHKGQGYIDPCDADFVNHFERYDTGKIFPKTDVGKYMFIQLKLGLRRHELIWLTSQLFTKLEEVKVLYELHKHSDKADQIARKLSDLYVEYSKYKGLFEETI